MGRLAVLCTFARLQLANSKIYREGFPPARINIVGKTFAKHLCLWNAIFPVKMPPVHKVWSWSLWGQGGSSWPQVNPACPLTLSPHSLHPFQLFGWLSWLKTRLKQAKWAQIAHETEPSWRLPDHPDGVGPSHHPSLHCPHCTEDDQAFASHHGIEPSELCQHPMPSVRLLSGWI